MKASFRCLIRQMTIGSLLATGMLYCPEAKGAESISVNILSGDTAGNSPFGHLIERFANFVLPPSPTEVLDGVSPEAGIFWRLVADCGYRVTEVVTESGILPKLRVSLERTLDLTEEDRTWIGHRLDDWAVADDGLKATLSRRVVIALLEASEDPRFDSVGVDITLFPLPMATFRLALRKADATVLNTGPVNGH